MQTKAGQFFLPIFLKLNVSKLLLIAKASQLQKISSYRVCCSLIFGFYQKRLKET